MTNNLFHWVIVLRDVLESHVADGDRKVIVQESGYITEVFRQGQTLEVNSVPASWVKILPEIWKHGQVSTIAAS
jgi:hypothetical protein